MVILPCLRGEQNAALSLAWSPWRGIPRTYIQSYRSRYPGARGELSLAYFDKSRAARLRSRHPTPKFRRKAITNYHGDGEGALSEERTCGDTIAYIRTLLSLTLWRTIPLLRTEQGDTTFARVGVIAFSLTMLTEERYYVTTMRLLCYRWLIVWENYYACSCHWSWDLSWR